MDLNNTDTFETTRLSVGTTGLQNSASLEGTAKDNSIDQTNLSQFFMVTRNNITKGKPPRRWTQYIQFIATPKKRYKVRSYGHDQKRMHYGIQ
jgi:hypothetical protein